MELVGQAHRRDSQSDDRSCFQGSLFTSDFLTQSIVRNAEWNSVSDEEIDPLAADLADLFSTFPTGQTPNETRTEDDLIWPIL